MKLYSSKDSEFHGFSGLCPSLSRENGPIFVPSKMFSLYVKATDRENALAPDLIARPRAAAPPDKQVLGVGAEAAPEQSRPELTVGALQKLSQVQKED